MVKQQQNESILGSYRVLDLTDENGILCGNILGELGADVLQIEKPEGHPARSIGPFYHDTPNPEKSLHWFAFCSNKRGITLDIETSDGRELFKRLVKKADFVLESFPVGYLNKLGLGYKALSRINPRLIMTSITPFGQTGPFKDYKTSDIVSMGMGGIMSVCGDADRAPLRVSIPQAYSIGSAHAAGATLIANYARLLTGKGQYVDCSIHECIAWLIAIEMAFWEFAKVDPPRSGPRRIRTKNPTLSQYPCKDGQVAFWLVYGRYGRRFESLAKWMDNEGMAGPLKNVKDWGAVDAASMTMEEQRTWEDTFAKFFMKHTKQELYQEAMKRGFILCPSNTIKDLAESPQLAAREFWTKVEHPELGTTFTYPGSPYRFDGKQLEIKKRAPLIGEHNQEIYEGELGLTKTQLVGLKQGGCI